MSKAVVTPGPEADAYWRKHVEEQQRSGLSKREYCRKNQLKDFALDYWCKKFNKPAPKLKLKGAFAKVNVVVEPPKEDGGTRIPLRLLMPNGLALEMAGEVDIVMVAKLLSLLGGSR